MTVSMPVGGRRGMVLQYFQIYLGSEHYFGFKFQKNEYFWGYEESEKVWIFLVGHYKIGMF